MAVNSPPSVEETPRGSYSAPPDTGSVGASRTTRSAVRYGKFLLVGFTGVFVNLAVFVITVDAVQGTPTTNFFASVLHYAEKTAANPLLYFVGSAVAFVVATLWNFALNSLWTFRTAGQHKHSGPRRLGLYFGVSVGSLTVNEVILLATETLLPPLIGQGLGIIAGSIVGFLGNSRFTFAETSLA
jgi:putative flippase GtrA